MSKAHIQIDDPRLGPYVAMNINEESYVFSLPWFTDTLIMGWAPYKDGVFDQISWSPTAIRKWHRKNRFYDQTHKWLGWLERLPIMIPVKENGRWRRYRLGTLVLDKLVDLPDLPGSHLVMNNLATQLVASEEVQGVCFKNNGNFYQTSHWPD